MGRFRAEVATLKGSPPIDRRSRAVRGKANSSNARAPRRRPPCKTAIPTSRLASGPSRLSFPASRHGGVAAQLSFPPENLAVPVSPLVFPVALLMPRDEKLSLEAGTARFLEGKATRDAPAPSPAESPPCGQCRAACRLRPLRSCAAGTLEAAAGAWRH